jgi:hypothetical protein
MYPNNECSKQKEIFFHYRNQCGLFFSVIPGYLGPSPWGVKRIATPIPTLRARWSPVTSFTLWPTYPREGQTSTQLTGGLVDLRAGLDTVKI